MYHSFLIHSSVDGYLGCFQILAMVNCAAMNIGVHISFLIGVSASLGCIPRSGIIGSNGSFIFNFLRKSHMVFHSGCTSLHSHQGLEFPPPVQEGSFFSASSPALVAAAASTDITVIPGSLHGSESIPRTFGRWLCSLRFFVDLLMIATLTGVRWYLIVISQMISDFEHVFICLLAF
uniref:Uncharacterized protein n=1 Tax=Myotis myotis TaxID=51298 RepID=A0A7J7XIU2_MYOMY|nr:hypothetical protein mMyoMyo1_011770 [Myotis myotis]